MVPFLCELRSLVNTQQHVLPSLPHNLTQQHRPLSFPLQVRLLLGEVPDRTEFTAPDWAQQLAPYFDITQASLPGTRWVAFCIARCRLLDWGDGLLCKCILPALSRLVPAILTSPA